MQIPKHSKVAAHRSNGQKAGSRGKNSVEEMLRATSPPKRKTSPHGPASSRKKRKGKKPARRQYTKNGSAWSLYILECGDGSLYTGISNDVQKRLACHQSGKGAKYTATHEPVKLMYVEECGEQGTAMQREREVKRFPKKKKLALINN